MIHALLQRRYDDSAAAEVLIRAASNVVDLWLEVGLGFPDFGRALLGVMPGLSTSETSIVALTIFQYRTLDIGLVLVVWLIVVIVAIVPGWLILGLGRLPSTLLL